jgi:hypothetical protein
LVLCNYDVAKKCGLFSDVITFMSGEFSKMFLGHGPIFDLELSLAFKSFFHPIDDWRRNVGLGDGGNGVDSFFSLLVVNV